jgi:CrcB protein
MAVLAALLAGAAAAGVRYLVTRVMTAPWGVLVVNVVGSAIGGAVLALAELGAVSADLRLVLLGGLCGGLTTFSTFSVETIQLVLERKVRVAVLSAVANLALAIAAASIAYLLLFSGLS